MQILFIYFIFIFFYSQTAHDLDFVGFYYLKLYLFSNFYVCLSVYICVYNW